MKQYFLFSFLLLSLFSVAQKPSNEEVLNAEKNFAAYSVAHGTKEAFLNFLDSNGVVFEKGKAVNGIEVWNKKEKGAGVLAWHPVYGGISSSGELGFTTGPWTFQPKSVDDSIVARGQYSTVWKKNKKGEWKFLVDLGINNTPAFDDAAYKFGNETTAFIPGTWNNLLNREGKFIRQTSEADADQRKKIYVDAVSRKDFFLNRNGSLPAFALNNLNTAIQTMPQKIEYAVEGSGISASGDLGYVYGTAVSNGKKDNYLRIWRREGKEWKLALETLRY